MKTKFMCIIIRQNKSAFYLFYIPIVCISHFLKKLLFFTGVFLLFILKFNIQFDSRTNIRQSLTSQKSKINLHTRNLWICQNFFSCLINTLPNNIGLNLTKNSLRISGEIISLQNSNFSRQHKNLILNHSTKISNKSKSIGIQTNKLNTIGLPLLNISAKRTDHIIPFEIQKIKRNLSHSSKRSCLISNISIY